MPIITTPYTDRIEYNITGNGAQTITLSDGAYRIDYEVVGGTGGTAGTSRSRPSDTDHPGGTGARGQKLVGTFKAESLAGKQISIYVGQNGNTGTTFSGGNGGSGFRSGGNGGYNYSEGSGGWYGAAGGGGGGSSAIVYSNSAIIVAGGGGGGGARMYLDLNNDPNGKTSEVKNNTTNNKSNSNGLNGTNSGASFNGAGGGGGGGCAGGNGGFAYISGNDISGEGGYGGDGFYDETYNMFQFSSPSVTTATTNGYVKLVVYSRPSYIRFNRSGNWKEVSKIFIHNGTSWVEQKQVYVRNNNSWKRIFG